MSEYFTVFLFVLSAIVVWFFVVYSEVRSFKIDKWKDYFSNRKDAVKDVLKVLAGFILLVLLLQFTTIISQAEELKDYRVRLSLGIDQPFNNRSNQCVPKGRSQIGSNMYASYALLLYTYDQYGLDVHHESCGANDDASGKSIDDYGIFYRHYRGKNSFHIALRSSKVTYITYERVVYRKDQFSIDVFLQTTKILNFKKSNLNDFNSSYGENVIGLYLNYHGNVF